MKITIELESTSDIYELRDLLNRLNAPRRSGTETVRADMPLEELQGFDDLRVLTRNCLRVSELNTISELLSRTDVDLLKLPNFGRKSLNEVKEWLATHGLTLKA